LLNARVVVVEEEKSSNSRGERSCMGWLLWVVVLGWCLRMERKAVGACTVYGAADGDVFLFFGVFIHGRSSRRGFSLV